mmetsp:Transcript_46089/g.141938  ORF Transcript_46089/g.141938 Transcript_46089/m.141938 type:complete len:143 (-) Transcript_46089:21-449(-)
MALVAQEEWEVEAKRINEAEGNFDVLGLVPPNVTAEDVKRAYAESKARLLTRESIRVPAVQRAKHLLEKAHAALGDPQLLAEVLAGMKRQRDARLLDAGQLEALRQRTKELEARAEEALQMRRTQAIAAEALKNPPHLRSSA